MSEWVGEGECSSEVEKMRMNEVERMGERVERRWINDLGEWVSKVENMSEWWEGYKWGK